VIERSREAEAFLETAHATHPAAVSACTGWTAHEVVAHVTGIAIEVAGHLEPYLRGDPVPETRSFEVREAPLRALPHPRLLVRLEADEERMRALVDEVVAKDPSTTIAWTGRRMEVAKFIPHLRNEHALHRWDLVGDGDRLDLLGQSDLVDHSVSVLGRILLVAGRTHDPAPDTDFRVRLRAPGAPDLLVVVQGGRAGLVREEGDAGEDVPTVHLDAAARHLLIWGRRPAGAGRMCSHLAPSDLARLQALLAGY